MAYTHVDVPWWVGHNDMELAQYGVVEPAQIAVDPLWGELVWENKLVVAEDGIL